MAEIVGSDPYTDIAVIRVNSTIAILNPLSIGNSNNLKVGEQVATIGNPFGLSGSMTSGIVSQIGRLLPQESGYSIPDVIQTDAAINPGNSGGPLLNMDAKVVGINTAIQSASGEFAGIGFAVPSATIEKIVPVLIETGEFKHPWIGIQGHDGERDLAKFREFEMPLFDGDLQAADGVPAGTQQLANRIGASDGVVIVSPEYNYGVPGPLKNAIDWLSRFRPFPTAGKTCFLASAAPGLVGGARGLIALRPALSFMGMWLSGDSFSLAQANQAMVGGKIVDDELDEMLDGMLDRFTKVTSSI